VDADTIAWETQADGTLLAHSGSATFRYDPAAMEMHWRGLTFHGVTRSDIDAFVHNREDR